VALNNAGLIGTAAPWGEDAQKKFNQERVKPAWKARRADDIQDIIERLARELWERKPSFKGNKHGTAVEIRANVVSEIRKLPKIPKGWILAEDRPDTSKREIENEIGRIAKRVPSSYE
jgi:hypothetical protein